MLTGLTISPTHGDPLAFSFPGGGDGYLIRRIEGLDPVPVTVSSNQLAQLDREVFQGSRREKRNIVISIKLDQNYAGSSIHSRRTRLYSLGLSKEPIRLLFNTTHIGEVYIDGYIETIESDIYTDDPVVTMSFVCLDPSFKSVDTHELDGVIGTDLLIDYKGSVEVGFYIFLHPIPPGDRPRNLRMSFQYEQTEETVGHFYAPVSFTTESRNWEISTIPGRRYFFRVIQENSWFNTVEHSSLIWPVLYPGETRIVSSMEDLGSRVWGYTLRWREGHGAI